MMAIDEFKSRLLKYRQLTFRTTAGLRIHTPDEALDFVNERGFVFFWPIKGIQFPSLWAANAGDRNVASDHDDPGHITWDWKDSLLGKKLWYYGRILKRKNAMASLEAFPYFYALTPNYGEYEVDYLTQYQQGLLTAESKAIYEALLFNGPMDTITLRKTSRMTSETSTNRFQRALDQLQVEMKILPVGISEAGAWKYSFLYDIVPRHFPWIETRAGEISESEARAYLLTRYLISLGAEETSHIRSMFRWSEKDLQRAINRILEQKTLAFTQTSLDGKPILALNDLL
ncbi:MAG: winged helix DNA-binding domain-containing protein [Chloroflexi bacterium]|nr:winged helix DNA-binding domain-containing protein [Chloroflexota bacterium]